MEYQLIRDYKHNDCLRKSFQELTRKTFGFDLEEWYRDGYWGDSYIPYSFVDGDKVISNVSVNQMHITMDGEIKNLIQLGTVMTEESYRNRGLGRLLIEEVMKEYNGKVDGVYLFANDSVLDYYPKFGFKAVKEYRYRKYINSEVSNNGIIKVDMNRKENREQVLNIVHNLIENNNLHMDNYGLYSFYLTGVMNDQVYYCDSEDAYVVSAIQEHILYLNQIIADHRVDTDKIAEAFGPDIKEVVLGFVPFDTTGYEAEEHKEEDCTLFVIGEALEVFDKRYLRFPVLSHA